MGIFAKAAKVEFKPQFLKSEAFINCCGANIIAYFPQGEDQDYEYLKSRIEKEVKWIQKNANNSMMLLIINHKQAKYFDEGLKNCGFKCLMRDVYHTGHGNNLSLYGWEKYEKRAPLSA